MTNSTDADETDTDENKNSSEREMKYIDRAIGLAEEPAEIGNTPFKAVTVHKSFYGVSVSVSSPFGSQR